MLKKIKQIISFLIWFKWFNVLYNVLLLKLYSVNYLEFPAINGRIQIRCNGMCKIGNGLSVNSGKRYNPIGGDTVSRIIVEFKKSNLIIGNNVGISNSTIVCHDSITIEDDVLIGGSCKIYDTDFHAIDYFDRIDAFKKSILDRKAKTLPVTIKKGAWVGGHCIILKGIVIGENAIIGAGSVVSKSIPDNEIWAGNPIKFIKKI